jgi:hypothetical protein
MRFQMPGSAPGRHRSLSARADDGRDGGDQDGERREAGRHGCVGRWAAVHDVDDACDRLAAEAAMKGYRVRYALATKLVNELVGAADEKQLKQGQRPLLAASTSPCIDERGYMELDRHGTELLFLVLTEREEKNSVVIASNESFGDWTKTFTDPRLCVAIVDRLTFNGTIIETGTDSYRLASTRARAEEPAKAG